MTTSSKTKFFVGGLSLYLVMAWLFLIFYQPVYLLSIFIVLAVPAVVVWWPLKNSRWRILWFSLVSLFLFAPPVELMARLGDSWDVASVLPRLWGTAPIENLIFAFFNFLLGLSLYELIAAGDRPGKLSRRFYSLVGLYGFFFALVLIFFKIRPEWVTMDYYQLAILVILIPLAFFVWWWPVLIKQATLTTLILGLIFFVYEIVALQLGYWWWPGRYLWPITIWGKVFPFDDVVFWYLLSTPALIGGYEFFVKGRLSSRSCPRSQKRDLSS